MNDKVKDAKNLSPLKRALLAVEEMKGKLKALQQEKTEPIAVVGIGLRFPGARGVDQFWEMLCNGVDAIREVPPDRWDVDAYYDPNPQTPGKMVTRWGGFIDDVDKFDPQFFGISPREAARMDPQQRLLLEVTWEALENAGINPHTLAKSKTGVFVGISSNDYSRIQGNDFRKIDPYTGTGNAFSIAANRLSYAFDFQGPSVAVDTACSSSLVTIHLAVQSLRNKESDLAVAGGVNLILSPELSITFSQAGMLAPGGRCRTFDASAEGYVRGEGCGMVVLKRLSDALRDGDRIYAVVRGSAVNQDGKSNGLTAPNSLAQQRVVRQALKNAGVKPEAVGYIEAHGTGTILGDPIEVQALGMVMKKRPLEKVCYLGSIKTNIGHLESAAGVAGFIKAVLAVHYGKIPPHLHFQQINPHIPINELPFKIPTQLTDWPGDQERRIAGVSSFGFGGTNAHIVVEEPPAMEPRENAVDRTHHLVTFSAYSQKALQEYAGKLADYLENHLDIQLADVGFTLNTGRAQLTNRAAVVAASVNELIQHLRGFQENPDHFAVLQGEADPGAHPKVAFLFTGQGAQYPGMGRTLYQTSPAAKKLLDSIDEIASQYLEESLLKVMWGEGSDPSLIHQTAYTQPALFAMEYSLAKLWMQWGVQPDYLIGHSIGEITAACIAEAMSLEDAVKLVCARGRLMQELPQHGSMAAVLAPSETVMALLQGETGVGIAGMNGPQNVVISGEKEAVSRILQKVEQQNIEYKLLKVSHAFHSPLMDPMLDEFEKIAGEITYQVPRIPLVSNVTGDLLRDNQIPDARYWRQHVRQPVQFMKGMETLAAQGVTVFLETGPHPVLIGMGRKILPDAPATWVPSLKRDTADWEILLQGAGMLFVNGLSIDLKALDGDYYRSKVSLPTYPFQRERYWVDWATTTSRRTARGGDGVDSLLGYRISSPLTIQQFENVIDHDVQETFGTAFFREVAYWPLGQMLYVASAVATWNAPESRSVKNLEIERPLLLIDGIAPVIQSIVHPEGDDGRVELFVQGEDEDWQPLAKASLSRAEAVEAFAFKEETIRSTPGISGPEWYKQLEARQIRWSKALQVIQQVWKEESRIIARLQFPKMAPGNTRSFQQSAALEALVQLIAGMSATATSVPVVQSIAHLQRLNDHQPVWCILQKETETTVTGYWLDEHHQVVIQATGITTREMTAEWGDYFAPFVKEEKAEETEKAPKEVTITREALVNAPLEERITMLQTVFRKHLAQVLKLSPARIDPRQPITNLGLDSILAIELKNNLENALGIEVPVAQFIEGPSVQTLSEQIARQLEDSVEGREIRVTANTATSGEFPLSYGQKAMWFQHQMAPKSIFNPAYAARVRAPIDVNRLRDAFQTVVDRHAMLRTTFSLKDGEPVQHVHSDAEVFFKEVDATDWNEEKLKQALNAEALHPFDLEKGPLFRIHLFHLGPEDHVLMMASHHIVVDMWSQAVITSEVNQLYNAGTELPPVEFQYMDFVDWQHRLLQSSRGEALFEYWKNELAGDLPILELPTDRPRPSIQTFEGRIQTLVLGDALTRKLRRFSEEQGVTLYMTLLAAFHTLLARYSGQDDIIVGTPTTGRSQPEFTNTVGYFVNPVAIRVDMGGKPSFVRLLDQVRRKVVGALQHQDYPINLLVEKLQPQRDPSRTPIFQVMFVYQRAHLLAEEGLSGFAIGDSQARLNLGGLPLEAVPIEDQVAPFDLTLMMAESAQGLAASITYNVNLFEEATIQRMLHHFRNLLEGVLVQPEQSIEQLPLLSDSEKRTLIEAWNPEPQQLTSHQTALEAFQATVQKYPQKTAVIFQDKELSYAELDKRANQLAHYLIAQGVGPETVVGICVDRSLEMVIGILGILKAGGAYLPLDPDYPQERLQYLIEDSGARLILTRSTTLDRLPKISVPHLCLDDERAKYESLPDTPPEIQVFPGNLAYMIYTSGSTGKPKGVEIEHRTLVQNLFSMQQAFHVTEASRVLQFASFSFDASVEEIFSALFTGGTLVLIPRDVLISGPALLEEMRRQQVTIATFPPSFSRVLPEADSSHLTTVISAGESCTPEIVQRWRSVPHFINAYGPTETTICATTYEVQLVPDGPSVPIGKPIPNVRVYILDEQLNPVPVGVAGELYIGGHAVGRGYHNRPELTAERFLPDPFAPEPGSRMYRTGDRARFLADGNIEFLGRVDFQVKVRGFRIELEEIEAHLLEHPAVAQAAVVARPNSAGEMRLVGYVVPRDSDPLETVEIRNYLKERLPDYMVPSVILHLESMPLSPSGKVDRKRLPAPEQIQKTRPEFVAPTSGIERQVADLWKEILQVEAVGVNDNFFDLGGHSLNVIQLQTRVKEVFNKDIAVVDLFKYPTVSAFARFLSDGHDAGGSGEAARARAAKQRSALDAQRARMRRRRQSG